MAEQDVTKKQDDETGGVITEADIERARQQIGVPQFVRTKTYNPQADTNSMTHFAYGNGDDNPLYHDLEYAKSSRWGDLIAAPIYPISAGICVTPKYDGEKKKLFTWSSKIFYSFRTVRGLVWGFVLI